MAGRLSGRAEAAKLWHWLEWDTQCERQKEQSAPRAAAAK